MARDPDYGEIDTPLSATHHEPAPPMLGQPLDALPPLGPVNDLGGVRALRRERAARLNARRAPGDVRARARSWAGRLSGRADRRLLDALAEAVDSLATHSDALVDRVNLQLGRESEISAVFGDEVSRLRAEVIHLRGLVAGPGHSAR
jgi:hypothetical protein